MYKLIACDLDETLLTTKEKKVSSKNIAAIQAARKLGVKFVPATGRGYNSISRTLEELELTNQPNEYVISLNGGAITENAGSKFLYVNALPRELAERLFERGVEYGICMQVHTKDKTYFYNLSEDEKAYQAGRMPTEEFFTPNLDFLKGQEVVKIVFVNSDVPYLEKLEQEMKPILGNVDVSYSSNRFLEFNNKGVSKGQGLLKLAQLLNIAPEETIAIGDNFNDLPMIQASGLGVGVKNSVEGIKKYCDYITTTTCDEDAVAEVIEKFILRS